MVKIQHGGPAGGNEDLKWIELVIQQVARCATAWWKSSCMISVLDVLQQLDITKVGLATE
jgi:hypothetical protein